MNLQMLSLGKFPSQPQCNNFVFHNPASNMLSFPAKIHETKLLPSPNRVTYPSLFSVFGLKISGFCICASNSGRKGHNAQLEMEEFDQDDDILEEDEDELDEDLGEEDEDDEVFVPLSYMKDWLENKPRGFGEGKVYDTSVEDKLMEEIEQSRRAQLANINKLKNNPVKPNSKKQVQEKNVTEDFKDGFCVRLVNLPKKMNIDKDLQLAFKGVPGIVDIVPVVSGNKKTRDPVCKGLAFIYFRSENDAYRFVQNFSGESISFGKIQKQIRYEIVSGCEKSVGETSDSSELAVSILDSLEENISRQFECGDEIAGDNGEDLETQNLPEANYKSNPEMREGSIVDSSSLKQKVELRGKEKKEMSKKKKQSIPKMNSLGSAKRLKVREKALFADAFSKYAADTSLATREQS